MKITILGSGTSSGVPMIGCKCRVCSSVDIRDKRSRPGIYISKNGYNILIDASQDLKNQIINKDSDIKGILITHSHADHVFGLDDTRIISNLYKRPMNLYCSKSCESDIRHLYGYAFESGQEGGGKPKFVFTDINSINRLGPFDFKAIEVFHGKKIVDGFILDNIAIVLDASYMSMETFNKIKNNAEYIIMNGLRMRPHATHFSISETAFLIKALNVKKGWMMHLSHDKLHSELENILPDCVFPSYDGMEIEI